MSKLLARSALIHNLATRYAQHKREAEDGGVRFDLTRGQYSRIVSRPCYYCRAEPQRPQARSGTAGIAMGLDRTNTRRGYTLTNTVPCCEVCLVMKRDLSAAAFLDQVSLIANRSDGHDHSTRTTYVSEANVGDTAKVMLLCIYDLVEKFNLQKAEVTALFKALLDEHIFEYDELNEPPRAKTPKKAGKPKRA